MNEYEFTLVILGISDLDDATLDKLFEAGCDDAVFGRQFGRVFADFDREAPSREIAVASAIADIAKAGLVAVLDEP